MLWWEVGAFAVLIALSWADELFGLPALLLGGTFQPNLREALLETIVILLVAVPLVLHTRRVVTRPFYFEGFLRVCAWCRAVEHEGDWIRVAEFFQERFDVSTSHGMCPACFMAQAKAGGVA